MVFDRSKFIGPYKAETLEHLNNLNLGLLKLEKNPVDKELLEYLMREAHTIKGSSSMMGYKRIAEIAHGMEDGLEQALASKVKLAKGHFDMLFKCLDAIGPLLEDKLTWDDTGVSGGFVMDLCRQIADVFAGKSSQPSEEKVAPKEMCKIQDDKITCEESIRVDIKKLDKLMNVSGELLISKIRLNELVQRISSKVESHYELKQDCGLLIRELNKVDDNLDFITKDIEDEVLKLRMVSVSYLFNVFPRAMRDLAIQKGKEVTIEIQGEDTQLDKAIIDQMKDPLMHILRNAVDHGIESPDERRGKNKPAVGTIKLNAFRQGSHVVLEVSDDGGGIDVAGVRNQAVKMGVVTQDKAGELVDEKIYEFLFIPGFSTSSEVTDVSGRGVGLDVVADRVLKLKGIVEVSSAVGKGTKFTIRLPLTMAITESLFVACGSEIFALATENVLRTMRIKPMDIRQVEGKEAISVAGNILPLVRLNDVFGLPQRGIIEKNFFSVVIVQSVEKKIALLVDQLFGRQKIVYKNLGNFLGQINGFSGSTILGDGRVILILDIPKIIDIAEDVAVKRELIKEKSAPLPKKLKTILLAEDTLTTAMLEKNILETNGFSVVIARDGQEALNKVAQEKFSLIITDVLMPGMDGFELTRRLKEDDLYKDIPVIIVTTRESDADKRRGLEVGAEAYILKSEFTSDRLLETIERLIG